MYCCCTAIPDSRETATARVAVILRVLQRHDSWKLDQTAWHCCTNYPSPIPRTSCPTHVSLYFFCAFGVRFSVLVLGWFLGCFFVPTRHAAVPLIGDSQISRDFVPHVFLQFRMGPQKENQQQRQYLRLKYISYTQEISKNQRARVLGVLHVLGEQKKARKNNITRIQSGTNNSIYWLLIPPSKQS